MKTTLNVPRDLLEEAARLAGARTKTEAVVRALEEFVRRQKIEEIIRAAGSLEFSDKWDEARHER
jgi:hypothetical protein